MARFTGWRNRTRDGDVKVGIDNWKTAGNLIDGLTELSESERVIVRTRWLDEARAYRNLWKLQRRAYYSLRIPMVIGATTVPALAGLGGPKIVTVLVGLVVAILTALDGLFRLGSRWQQARFAEEMLSSEGWRFLGLTGEAYEGIERRQDAYEVFLERLEDQNEQLSLVRLGLFNEKGQVSNQP
jgi:hypothetical protein